ncbi:cysteine desulfurase family protein [Geosporobacter ferrireducens]|uniref:Cysteine desulfurase NifS n=1 Tax=Geosporobacter ferrireducens TaxID=1424294 RepID=A0A1D8GCP9_9FIRM|nr:cysteine desulfurase family protein [Geosporobacter ferrireducens]AOT68670.1 cysteine desulfurase NifS [Geosporobacter ferrireducens]MTI54147.1 cysteine desulfurase [Geosporobacter ferrireducens]
MEAYFDNSATTKPSKEVVETMLKALTIHYGNPSSLHRKGVEVEKLIKASRRQVAKALGVKDEEIIFTSGGTESNNAAILGTIAAQHRRGNKIITSSIEHPSVLNVFKYLETKGYSVVYLDVDRKGKIDLHQLEQEVDENTILLSIMHVNNEVGTIQPIEKIRQILNNSKNKIILHVDAVQSFGKLKMNPSKLGIDLLSISGHKIHGPKGIGALYIRKDLKFTPIIYGGGQEIGIRPGTENVPGILGLGIASAAIEKEIDDGIQKMVQVKERLKAGILSEIKDAIFNGCQGDESAPHILSISFPGIRGEVLLHMLEQDEIYVSTGSACSSKKSSQSHVLKAMGLSEEEIEGAIRFSFSYQNTIEEVDYVLNQLKKHIYDLKKIMMKR